MLRKIFVAKTKERKDTIKWRGHEVTRMEAFSDAVFAFAITLLIVALEVPENYEELMHCMRFFIPFSICFIIVFQVWLAQNLFFRRFGLSDEWTHILNGTLLFTVLFFMYPLKFLFASIFMRNSGAFRLETEAQVQNLFYIYSGGFAFIYLLFTLMYVNAYRRRLLLGMADYESFETKTYVYRFAGMSGIGMLSMCFASFGGIFLMLAWMVYPFIGIVVAIIHSRRGKAFKKLFPNYREAVVTVSVQEEMAAAENKN